MVYSNLPLSSSRVSGAKPSSLPASRTCSGRRHLGTPCPFISPQCGLLLGHVGKCGNPTAKTLIRGSPRLVTRVHAHAATVTIPGIIISTEQDPLPLTASPHPPPASTTLSIMAPSIHPTASSNSSRSKGDAASPFSVRTPLAVIAHIPLYRLPPLRDVPTWSNSLHPL